MMRLMMERAALTESPQPTPFSAWLDAAMARRGIRQADLARELGLSQSTVSRWRQGGGIDLGSIERLARYFGVARETLERLTLADASTHDSAEATPLDPELEAERAEYRAFWEQMLRHVPRPLWKSYRDAVEAVSAPFRLTATGEHLTAATTRTNSRGAKSGRGRAGGGPGDLTHFKYALAGH